MEYQIEITKTAEEAKKEQENLNELHRLRTYCPNCHSHNTDYNFHGLEPGVYYCYCLTCKTEWKVIKSTPEISKKLHWWAKLCQ